MVHIAANRRFVVFSSRTYTVISRLIEGDFLDYKRVIPEGYHTRVTVDVRDFSNSIERASLIITERLKNPLRITFDGNITVRCQTTLGKVVDELDAEIEGCLLYTSLLQGGHGMPAVFFSCSILSVLRVV